MSLARLSRTPWPEAACSLQCDRRDLQCQPRCPPNRYTHDSQAQCNVPPVLEYPRISPCNLHARHQARHRCSHVIMLYARHRPHDDVSVAASIVLQHPDTPLPMQGPLQAAEEHKLLTLRCLCTIVSPPIHPRFTIWGPQVARGDEIGKMRWPHSQGRRNKELTHPPASFMKPQSTAR